MDANVGSKVSKHMDEMKIGKVVDSMKDSLTLKRHIVSVKWVDGV